MTREEAIKRLNDQLNTWEVYDPNNQDLREAIEMAIEALERPEGTALTYDEKCIFLSAISRERRICQEMDAEDGTIIKPLVPIVDTIIRKVKAVLWGNE